MVAIGTNGKQRTQNVFPQQMVPLVSMVPLVEPLVSMVLYLSINVTCFDIRIVCVSFSFCFSFANGVMIKNAYFLNL